MEKRLEVERKKRGLYSMPEAIRYMLSEFLEGLAPLILL
jgi:hypothetical protein